MTQTCRVLAIGPDPAGNLLEVIWLELAGDVELVIQAMRFDPTATSRPSRRVDADDRRWVLVPLTLSRHG